MRTNLLIAALVINFAAVDLARAQEQEIPKCVLLFKNWLDENTYKLRPDFQCDVKIKLDGKLGLIESVDMTRCQPKDREKVGGIIWSLPALPLSQKNGCAETNATFRLGGNAVKK